MSCAAGVSVGIGAVGDGVASGVDLVGVGVTRGGGFGGGLYGLVGIKEKPA